MHGVYTVNVDAWCELLWTARVVGVVVPHDVETCHESIGPIIGGRPTSPAPLKRRAAALRRARGGRPRSETEAGAGGGGSAGGAPEVRADDQGGEAQEEGGRAGPRPRRISLREADRIQVVDAE